MMSYFPREILIFTLILLSFISNLAVAVIVVTPTAPPKPVFSNQDSVINESIKHKISSDPRITTPNVEVKTTNGVVNLIGHFGSLDEIGAVIEIIASTPGVSDIDTSAVVVGSTPIDATFDDAVMSARIKGLLIREKIFGPDPDYVINIETKDGVVFLTGAVSNPALQTKAIELSQTVPKVKKVISTVVIKN